MRIMYVTSMLPYGSSETFILPEIRRLRAEGHDVLVVPMWPRGELVHGDGRDLSTRREPLLSLEIAREALRTVGTAPARAAIAAAPVLLPRARASWLKNCLALPKGLWLARVAHDWGAEHIHAHWAATPSTMAYVASEISGIPWSFTAHRWDIAENNLIARKASTAKFIRAISQSGAGELASLVSAADRAKISILHVGIEMPPRRRPPPATPGRPARLLEAANLKSGKGHTDLIHAMKLLRDRGIAVELDLAGEGPLRQEFEALATKIGVGDRVRFLGCVPHDELLRDMSSGRWDLFVLPSLMEGIPVSVMEAMAAGIPVVVTPVGGVTELVRPETGVIVPPGDARALAEGLASIISSPARWPRLAEAGREAVETSFRVERIVPELVRLMSA